MTKSVGVHEAKTHLSRLIDRVRAGEEIIIERRGHPVARLVSFDPPLRPTFGTARGTVVVHEDFDDPLPDYIASAFHA